jgi:hypothetical protein
MTHLGLQRIMIPSAQVSSLTTGSITLPSAKGAFNTYFGPYGAYESLASVNLTSAASSVTFSGIPSGYKHLQLRIFARTDRASSLDNLYINFNGDTSAVYASRRFEGDGSAAYSDGFSSSNQPTAFLIPTAANSSNVFCGGIMDILDYSSTTKNKNLRTLRGFDMNGTGYITTGNILWSPSTPQAINSLTLTSGNSANIVAYSSFALYGVK